MHEGEDLGREEGSVLELDETKLLHIEQYDPIVCVIGLEMTFRDLGMLGRCSTTEPYPQPLSQLFYLQSMFHHLSTESWTAL